VMLGSIILPEKLLGPLLAKKLFTFCVISRPITGFTRTCHPSLDGTEILGDQISWMKN